MAPSSSSPSELTLDYCKPHHSNSMLLKSFGSDHHQYNNYKLQDFVSRLEEERLKIDAFKRELPLCMQLLTNAMEASRQQVESHRGNEGSSSSRPAILEEFMPLKKYSTTSELSCDEKTLPNLSDNNKANWMTSAQLWSQTSEEEEEELEQEEIKPPQSIINDGGGEAFLPELALISASAHENPKKEKESSGQGGNKGNNNNNNNNNNSVSSEQKTTSNTTASTSTAAATTTHRKARRCWSPDLHRRFVNALHILGGSQVATPKQIRELMKVDGLTNDEVKSHLQKYRLHTRRPSPSPQGVGGSTPQLVVLGGIWVPPEYAAATAANTLFNFNPHATSHAPPQHYCNITPVPQDFYTTTLLQPPHSQAVHRLHMYKTTSHNQRSPKYEARGMGERSESIEDGKSENSS